MGYKELVELMKRPDKQYLLNMGAGKLSKRFKVSREDVFRARNEVRKLISPPINAHQERLPKILVFDIETSPTIAVTFSRFKANIGLDNVIQDPIMLTFSAKWLFSPDVIYDAITPEEVRNFDDYRIVVNLWKLIDQADLVIAHYGEYFDLPFLNSRAIIHGLAPYSPVRSIDTKRVASSQFRFPSNKLDALGEYFKVGKKIKTDINLWMNCIRGDQEALDNMSAYNNQDVILLEEVYLKLRPWIKSHPNLGMYMNLDETVCSCCGSTKIYEVPDRFFFTQTTKYPVYRCFDCGGQTRGRKTILDKTVKTTLGTSIPK